MLQPLLEPGVLTRIAEPWMWDQTLCAAEEALIERAVDKRKREFRAGRNCAHSLFDDHNILCEALLKGRQREPAWPSGWVGSISHTNGFCAVALASQQHYQAIGLDVEQASPLTPDIVDMICSPREQDHFSCLKLAHGQKFASLPFDKIVFSAKESVHKTYFPLNYHTLDFLDARIEIDPETCRFTAFILNPEPNPQHRIKQLQGRYTVNHKYVATLITLPR